VKSGDKFQLKDDAGKTYDIDHQDDVKKFEGKRVSFVSIWHKRRRGHRANRSVIFGAFRFFRLSPPMQTEDAGAGLPATRQVNLAGGSPLAFSAGGWQVGKGG
jgi:hypothetical protein